jgi:outer membrane PBP1 activator LpoA protein
MAQTQGMQRAIVIATPSGLSRLMAEAFRQAWMTETGLAVQQIDIQDDAALAALRSTLTTQLADFIVLAADFEEARRIRPYMDIATPTFGFSHIYSGLAYDPANAALSGIRFVDIPWVLKPGNAAFSEYSKASMDLPPGDMQRWFALGADAYRVLSAVVQSSLEPSTIHGLTGEIHLSTAGEITRELAVARFGADGVVVEHLP